MKRVKLSHDLPKEIQKELHSDDTKLSSIKDYLSATTHIQASQLDTLIDTKIKNKPLQLVNMIDNTFIHSQEKIPFLPNPKHVKSWTVKQLPEHLQRYHISLPLLYNLIIDFKYINHYINYGQSIWMIYWLHVLIKKKI